MSYTNGTTHYNLPLTTGADKRDWSDTNQAFSDVDSALYGAVQDTAQAELDIDALETRMDTAEQNISTNTGNIAGLDTRLTTAEGAITSMSGQITDTRQDLEDMICAYNEASATSTHAYAIGDYFIYNDVLYKATQAIAIGDTIVPDTNCATTNVTTELLATEDLSGDVQQLQSDVGQLQTDVGQLQTDIGAIKSWKVKNSITATSGTMGAAFNQLFTDQTITRGNDYKIYCINDGVVTWYRLHYVGASGGSIQRFIAHNNTPVSGGFEEITYDLTHDNTNGCELSHTNLIAPTAGGNPNTYHFDDTSTAITNITLILYEQELI